MKRSVRIASVALVCVAGALAACNLVLGLDDLKDQVDGGPADSGARDSSKKDGGDGGDAGDGGDGAVPVNPCAAYCISIANLCELPNIQYLDQATCLSMCATFPLGTSAQNANTLACRLANLNLIEFDASKPGASCGSAGPYAPTCGGEGVNFCALYVAACGSTADYGPNCSNSFLSLPKSPDGGLSFIPEHPGNSQVCREYQLESAFRTGGGVFCLEASKASSGTFCQ